MFHQCSTIIFPKKTQPSGWVGYEYRFSMNKKLGHPAEKRLVSASMTQIQRAFPAGFRCSFVHPLNFATEARLAQVKRVPAYFFGFSEI
jgi:hypothetical protein